MTSTDPELPVAVASDPPAPPVDDVEASLYEKRQKIYPREVHGWFATMRVAGAVGLLGLFYGVCWLRWDERQLLLFDLPARRFNVFWWTFYPQDFLRNVYTLKIVNMHDEPLRWRVGVSGIEGLRLGVDDPDRVVAPGDRLTLRFARATRAGADVRVLLIRDAGGVWRGVLPEMAPGKWYVELGNERWRLAAPVRMPVSAGEAALRALPGRP